MRHRLPRLPLLLLLAAASAGCPAPGTAPDPKGSTPPRTTRPPTPTPAPVLTATPAPGPGRTATPAPTSAPTGTPGPTAIPGPTATPAPTATPQAPTLALTRFATLVDFDAIANWVPGEVVDGPVHVNRGPVPADVRDAGGNTPGRSLFAPWVDGQPGNVGFTAPAGGQPHPIFRGPVSLGYAAGLDKAPPGSGAWGAGHWLGGNLPDAATFDRAKIFTHPANATALDGKPGPLLVPDVPLPGLLAQRMGEALGLPAGTDPASLPWFGALPDGVYVPTSAMATGGATAYAAGQAPAGGIYVRGTVELMRAAVDGDRSYLMIQVGYPGEDPRRTYVVKVDRAARTLKLTALPAGTTLREALAVHGGNPEGLSATQATETTDLAAWGLTGTTGATMTFTASGRPFNGVVAVDRSIGDPLRDPAQPGRLLPATASRRGLTGHILALGDPDPTAKPALRGAAASLPAGMTSAEVFSTEDPREATATTGLTIAAAGSVYVQNHLVVAGVHRAAGAPATLDAFAEGLTAARITPAATRDRLAVWADHQVFVGRGAPSVATRGQPGLVLTASLIGLGDPGRERASRMGTAFPAGEAPPNAYFGSVSVEGVMPIYNVPEAVAIGRGAGGKLPPLGDDDVYAVANPIYAALGYDALVSDAGNPNKVVRGKMVLFGSRISAKRGLFGMGNLSYDRDHRHDVRLGELPPPLVP